MILFILSQLAWAFDSVQYVKNYDGDTVTFNIPNIHPLFGEKISVRVYGIDTPEIRTKNVCEKKKALLAKKLVERLLKDAKDIKLNNLKRGKYFRIVADIVADGKNVKDELIKNKLAVPYYGKTKRKVDWCLI